ncbi:MAG: L,D-transpeptidase [Brachyspira sp.]|nr:L,D-transpeptidase [Brachyspira sp.]
MIRINNINFNTDMVKTTENVKKYSEINTVFGAENSSNIDDEKGLSVEQEKVSPKGSSSPQHLKNAPSPIITIAGEKKLAAIVVDTKTNLLYTYDDKGNAKTVYSVATGKKYTPTRKGIKMITNVEAYPYKTAYGTKRKKNPNDYGPNVIIIENINPETGKIYGRNGQFIHGNNNPKSLGTYASLGCIRMDNEVIKKIAKEAVKNSYVLIQ